MNGDIERLVLPKTLKESIGKPQSFSEVELAEAIKKAELNPFYQYLVREGIYADYSQALGAIHDKVVEAAAANLIGRELLTVIPVTKDPVRFIKATHGAAWETGEAETPVTPEMYSYADVSAHEYKSRAEWSETFLEDAEWNAEARLVKECGRALGQFETEKIIAMFNAVLEANMSGGSETVVTAGDISFANIKSLISSVENENFHPKVIALNVADYYSLFDEDQFVNSLYYAPEKAMRTGVVDTTLGVKFVRSSLITTGKPLCIDTDYAVLTVRREVNSKPYENPAKMIYGLLANERVGMDILREKAMNRGNTT